MEATFKFICILGLLLFVSFGEFIKIEGAGECGKNTTPDNEAIKLAPCVAAAQDATVSPSANCCAVLRKIGQNPSCLCAILLSDTAKSTGVDPQTAMSIPKRCNIANRPIGYKCGQYTLP